MTLAAEVRRLRAAYERIAEIPAIGLSCGEPTLARQHVLRAISDEEHLPWMEEYATMRDECYRLRAAVEQVKEGNWITRFDVIAILEGTDDA